MGDCQAASFLRDRQAANLLGNRQVVNSAKPGTRAVSVLFLQSATSFQLPGGVRILAHPEEDGGDEVNT
jgi:hypothetical protein